MEEKITLDTTHFDYIVLGTDLPESILSAALAKQKLSVLTIDISTAYSGTIKSLNLKDLCSFVKEQPQKTKDELFSDFMVHRDYSLDNMLEAYGFRGFNIDLEPRFIFSDSYSTEELISMGVDNYLSFQACKEVCILKEQTLSKLPISKAEILKSDLMNLTQKRDFVKGLERLQKLVKTVVPDEEGYTNSTKDFEKEIYTDVKPVEPGTIQQDDDGYKALIDILGDNFAVSLLRYGYLNRIVKAENDKLTVKEMCEALKNFIGSIGVHSKIPFLYPVYGIGDLPQIYARVSALNSGIFLINPLFKIQDLNLDKCIELGISHCSYDYKYTSDRLIVGQEYTKTILGHLNNDGEKDLEYLRFVKIIALAEIKESDRKKLDYPLLITAPENHKVINNSTPMRIIITGESTKSTPEGLVSIYITFQDTEGVDLTEEYTANIATSVIEILYNSKDVQLELKGLMAFKKKTALEVSKLSIPDKVYFCEQGTEELTIEDGFQKARDMYSRLGYDLPKNLIVRK